MPHTLQELAEFTATRLIVDGGIRVNKVASIEQAQPGDLVFVQEDKHLQRAVASRASVVIAGEFAAGCKSSKPLLIAANPRLAFCRAGTLLHPAKTYPPGVHPTAVVDRLARIAASAAIDAHAVIGAASIGERSHIGAGCSIGDGVTVGDDCDLSPRVVIYPDTTLD